MKTPEGHLRSYARKRLRQLGAYVFSPVQRGYGATTLDDLCCMKGRFVAIEYKRPGKEPTARQYHVMEQIKAAGGTTFACDSRESFEDALKFYQLIEVEGCAPPAEAARRSQSEQ